LNDWVALLPVKAEGSGKTTRASRARRKSPKLDVKRIRRSINQFIDDSAKALADLRSELADASPKQKG